MASKKIRIGIIGANVHYGWGTRAHIPALLALPEYELAAVCTTRRETAEESAKHYGVNLAFHDYNEIAKHPDIDLVSVCVRAPLHHRMVMAALKAGKHVFCEWPLGANLAEAEEMASMARSKGVCAMVGLQARGDPALLLLQELLSEGYVGEILACNMTMFLSGILEMGLTRAWMADRENGAHTLSIPTGHSLDALCFCVGDFKEVSAHIATQVTQWETSEKGQESGRDLPRQRGSQRSAHKWCRRLLPWGAHALARHRLADRGLWQGGHLGGNMSAGRHVRPQPASGRP